MRRLLAALGRNHRADHPFVGLIDFLKALVGQSGVGMRWLAVLVHAQVNAFCPLGVEPHSHEELLGHFDGGELDGVPAEIALFDLAVGDGHVFEQFLVLIEQIDVKVLVGRLVVAIAGSEELHGRNRLHFSRPLEGHGMAAVGEAAHRLAGIAHVAEHGLPVRSYLQFDFDASDFALPHVDRMFFRTMALQLERQFVASRRHPEQSVRLAERLAVQLDFGSGRHRFDVQLRRRLRRRLDILRADNKHGRSEEKGVHHCAPVVGLWASLGETAYHRPESVTSSLPRREMRVPRGCLSARARPNHALADERPVAPGRLPVGTVLAPMRLSN